MPIAAERNGVELGGAAVTNDKIFQPIELLLHLIEQLAAGAA
jgi:hypothetical protein